jgi:hypothetical protein
MNQIQCKDGDTHIKTKHHRNLGSTLYFCFIPSVPSSTSLHICNKYRSNRRSMAFGVSLKEILFVKHHSERTILTNHLKNLECLHK